MNLKKKMLTGVSSIALGAVAVMGGTFAYFSDEVEAQSKFTNGTLNLQPEAPYLEHFTLTNFKPGDKLEALVPNQEPAMVLNNQGTLPMNVFMKMDSSDFKGSKDAYIVKELKFGGEDLLAKYLPGDSEVTLAELDAALEGDTSLNGNNIAGVGKYIGFLDAPGTNADPIKAVTYAIEFKDTGSPQNNLQGDEITIDFKFTGLQYEGETFNQSNIDNGSAGGGGNFQRNDDVNERTSADDKTN
jgi:spore coat-associated protein N